MSLQSMTGFGKGRFDSPEGRFTAEIKSVNSRFLEISIHLPREFSALEHHARRIVKESLERGCVECRVRFEPAGGAPAPSRINVEALQAYAAQLRAAAVAAGAEGPLPLGSLLSLPGVVVQSEEGAAPDAALPAIEACLRSAIEALRAERAREGAELALKLTADTAFLRAARDKVEANRETIRQRLLDRLRARFAELESQLAVKFEPGRMEAEAALMADRSDVSEELARLAPHLDQLDALIANREGKPRGKAMDFLVQELLRETNTIASKSRDLEIGRTVLEMKSAIERLREQVQNIE